MQNNQQLISWVASIVAAIVGALLAAAQQWLSTHKTKKLQGVINVVSSLATTAVHLYEDGVSENSGKTKHEKYGLAVSFIQDELTKRHIKVSDDMVTGAIDVALSAMDTAWAQVDAAKPAKPAESVKPMQPVVKMPDSASNATSQFESKSAIPSESVSTSESMSESTSVSDSEDKSFHWGGVADD